MKKKQSGGFRLFFTFLFFCVSIFFLNTNKKQFVTATHIDLCSIKDSSLQFSLERIYREIDSLLAAHDIDLIVKVLAQLKYNCALEFIEKMIGTKEGPLSSEEKATVLFGVIAHYSSQHRNIHYELLDLLLKYPYLDSQTPALLSLARSKYADVVSLFISWGKDRQKTEGRMGLLAGYAERAFKVAVEENDPNAVEILFSKKVRINPSIASDLLAYVVEQDKDNKLVSLLIDHAQADVNHVINGKTLLVAAVEKNNSDAVRTLLDKGAVVDRVIDADNGTALAIALKNKHTQVAELLQEYGA